MIYGYDLDGVLAQGPPESPKPWRKMNGPERSARKLFLLDWYRNAAQLYIPPPGQPFYVITARKDEPAVRKATEDWLRAFFPGRVMKVFMLQESRSIENVVAFKSGVIRDSLITDYHEDNWKVVKALSRAGLSARIWHYQPDGRLNLVTVR